MCSDGSDWALPQPGFPIRKSSDHSSVDSSPRLIAASYVLHRLLVPRHPPCALTNLTTKMLMLASTMQFSRYGRESTLALGHDRSHGAAESRSLVRVRSYPRPQDPTVCCAPSAPSSSFHTASGSTRRPMNSRGTMSMFHPVSSRA